MSSSEQMKDDLLREFAKTLLAESPRAFIELALTLSPEELAYMRGIVGEDNEGRDDSAAHAA